MNEKLDWNDIRYFLAVASHQSLTAAAHQLHSSPATVSRKIQALEHSIGYALFTRHVTGYFLTGDGERMLVLARQVEESVLNLTHSGQQQKADAVGDVRIATSEMLALDLIGPALPKLKQDYPNLKPELVVGIGYVSLTRREADIALRLTRPNRGNLITKQVGRLDYALYASRNLAARFSLTKDMGLENLPAVPRVDWTDNHADIPAAIWQRQNLGGSPVSAEANRTTTQLCLVRAGLGVTVLPCMSVVDYDDLIRITPPIADLTRPLWLIVHKDLRHSPRYAAVFDFLEEVCLENADLLQGRSG